MLLSVMVITAIPFMFLVTLYLEGLFRVRYADASRHSNSICIGIFRIQTEERLLLKGDETVKKLSLFEYKLLLLLVQKVNEVVTRSEMEQELWEGVGSNEHSLNNYIAHLRKYLSEDERMELTTIQGFGYKLIYNA